MKCRGRNAFAMPVDHYIRTRKCRHCGHTKFYVAVDRIKRPVCKCDGGLLVKNGSIPHRPGAKCCLLNPAHPWYRAQREGASQEDLMEIAIELAWEGEGGRAATADDVTAPF